MSIETDPEVWQIIDFSPFGKSSKTLKYDSSFTHIIIKSAFKSTEEIELP